MEPFPDWTRLPGEILSVIASLLPTLADYIFFRSVCRSYRSAPPRRSPFPLLLYPSPCRIEHDGSHIISYIDFLQPRLGFVDLPEARSTLFCGSDDGLLFLSSNGIHPPYVITLLNPVTRSRFLLPSLDTPPEKIILTSLSPFSAVANLGYSSTLRYWSQGSEDWDCLPHPEREEDEIGFHDMIPYRGRLYAVDDCRRVFVFASLVPDSPPVQLLSVESTCVMKVNDETKNYLVEWDGDLLLVSRYLSLMRMESPMAGSRPIYSTSWFEVFKLEDLDGVPTWSAVESLGDGILFLGVHRSFSISARDVFSTSTVITADKICFSDDFTNDLEVAEREKDFGCFSIKEGLLYHCMCYPSISLPLLPPAIYFTPRL